MYLLQEKIIEEHLHELRVQAQHERLLRAQRQQLRYRVAKALYGLARKIEPVTNESNLHPA